MTSVTYLSRRDSRCDRGVSHGCPDPTRPDPVVTEVFGSWANQVQIATAVTREAAAIGFGAKS